MTNKVIIVGAGLSGLCCARRLQEQGIASVVLEAADGVGGRIRTDTVDGFRLDRGFQIFRFIALFGVLADQRVDFPRHDSDVQQLHEDSAFC